MNVEKAAQEDYEATKWAIKKMSLRKFSPPWSVPTEIWCAVMHPNWFWKPQRVTGIGIEKRVLQPTLLEERMRGLMTQIRRVNRFPLLAYRSFTVQTDKGNDKKGYTKRLYHVLDPFGRAWYKGALKAGHEVKPPESAHGFLRGRRREAAVAVQLTTSWRLQQTATGHITNFQDCRVDSH